jgi:short-subunit dehydrogenase
VVASARGAAGLDELSAKTIGSSGQLRTIALDVSSAVAVTEAVEFIENRVAPIALAILNAGSHRPTPAADLRAEDFAELVAVNLMGTVNCLAAVLGGMRDRRHGHVAVVSSLAGYVGLPTAAAYGMTKAGLINMCEALQPELNSLGIGIQVVNPGFVRTPLTEQNRFHMPFLMSPEDAAAAFHRGLNSRRFEVVFPWRFAILMKALRLMPYGVALRITRRLLPRDQSQVRS